jgi:hypothetical protein
MKERPILFNAEMVRAILEGKKTQTRRIFKTPSWSDADYSAELYPNLNGFYMPDAATGLLRVVQCPLGLPGDLLWVRESFQPLLADGIKLRDSDYKTGVGYAPNYVATSPVVEFMDHGHDDEITPRITPSIFMPRWASRITLEITDVRVQRLQEISEEEARLEGCSNDTDWDWRPTYSDPDSGGYPTYKRDFQELWDSINLKRCPWSSNPWLWVLTFKVVS